MFVFPYVYARKSSQLLNQFGCDFQIIVLRYAWVNRLGLIDLGI